MAKDWKDLTTDEKLEALRADIAKIFGAFNALAHDVGADHRRLNECQTKLNEVAKAVEALERRRPGKAA